MIANSEWQKPQQEAFDALIEMFITAPILRHYDPSLPARVETDASSMACAGILSLLWEDGSHPVAYVSKKFSGAELHYPIYDKELYAIVWSFQEWRHYLEGAPNIEVWSDHENLKGFMQQKTLNGRQVRWLLKLAPYDFTIHYRKGKLNPADGPSRRPDYVDAAETPDTVVARLMPSLENRLACKLLACKAGEHKSMPEQQLAAASCRACERSGTGDPYSASSLTTVLSMQAMTRSAVRKAFEQTLPGAEDDERPAPSPPDEPHGPARPAPEDQPSGSARPAITEDSSGERRLLAEPEGVMPLEKGSKQTDEVGEATADNPSLVQFLQIAQESDPQCRGIARRLRDLINPSPSVLSKRGGSLIESALNYSLGKGNLLRHDRRVLVPQQESLRAQIIETYYNCPARGH